MTRLEIAALLHELHELTRKTIVIVPREGSSLYDYTDHERAAVDALLGRAKQILMKLETDSVDLVVQREAEEADRALMKTRSEGEC